MWRTAASGALIATGALLAWTGHPGSAIAADLAAIALVIGQPAARAWRSLCRRALDINVLMLIAVVGAGILGDWLEAASVVWLFGIAQSLESRSMARAERAVRSLVTLAPTTAIVRRDDIALTVPIAEVMPGDTVIVKPGGRIPVDGVIHAGETAVDQSPVTGESFPVDKGPGDRVFAGTINGTGSIDVVVERPASDSTLARIIHSIEHAREQRAPVQTFVERFAARYTPAVVLLALAVAVVPPLVLFMSGAPANSAFATWSYRALVLLVVACPCALVISTPVSIVSALTAAARAGVLIKGGTHLERLSAIRCVAFDKTGTLTSGDVAVADVVGVDGASVHGVLSVAAALESRSEHPIGRAIVDRARASGLQIAPGEAFRALPGLGAEATVASAPALIGSHRLFEDRQLCTPALHDHTSRAEEGGATAVLVGHAGAALGLISVTSTVRSDSRRAVRELRAEGIRRIVLLTGDGRARAEAVREHAELDEAHADLMPDDKVSALGRLRAAYGPIAMVGDGLNDAPALAAADVGIAMGVAGTDVALETADVALMSDDLAKLPYAIRLGRATLSNIRVNIGVALGLKAAFLLLAMSGVATLWMAVLADTGASLIVTANSLRLLNAR
jgi:Cd2+/Zn2+-exporting ATPase